jgi:hypothetical protein
VGGREALLLHPGEEQREAGIVVPEKRVQQHLGSILWISIWTGKFLDIYLEMTKYPIRPILLVLEN